MTMKHHSERRRVNNGRHQPKLENRNRDYYTGEIWHSISVGTVTDNRRSLRPILAAAIAECGR